MRADDLKTVDRQCIHFVDELPADFESLFDGIVARCNCSGVTDREDFLRRIAAALKFPDYFGNNWDALDECLRDLEWLPGSAYVLVVEQSLGLWSQAPKLAGALVESWLFASEAWSSSSVPFHLVFTWGSRPGGS